MKFRSRIHWPRAVSTSYMPAQLAAAYQFPKITGGMPQVIGIIELGGGENPSDTKAAFSGYGQPAPNVTSVGVDGATNSPGSDADGEVALDIQVAASVYSYCTGQPATVRVYYAPNSDQGFMNAIKRAIADGCSTISISWGGPEDSWGQALCQQFDAVCAAAASAGVTIFAASGDNDSADGESGAHVDFPASSPNVVGCGGTNKTATGESVWNSGPGEGTGGGFSAFFPLPAWQIGVKSTTHRGVPDVAADADPATGYKIFLNGAWQVIGGTSAVAPLYAGLFAAINAALVAQGKPRVGFVLPTLYTHPAAFADVTSGNNGQWRAGTGWDPCTGLGVPIGVAILAAVGGGTAPIPPSPPAPPPPSPPGPPPPPPPPVVATYDEMRLLLRGATVADFALTPK